MDPFEAIALAVAFGASAIERQASEAVKDAYQSLLTCLRQRYSEVYVKDIEEKPESEYIREKLVESLRRTNAGTDPELADWAKNLIDILYSEDPKVLTKLNISSEDLRAANTHLENILSTGSGISIRGLSAGGNISIGNVRAGIEPVDPWPLPGKTKK
jgi:hypothetical protein